MPGAENRLIRYYFYVNKGLDILNQFRNLFLGIIAIYFALKLTSYWLLIAMFIPSIIGLAIVGYYSVHKMSKIMEWLNLRFSTHYGIRTYDYTKGAYEQLQEINRKLK